MKKLIRVLFLCAASASMQLFCQSRLSSYPFISGDSFRAIANQLYDETSKLDPKDVQAGDIVFVKSDMLATFFTHAHPHINQKYILISHNSDAEVPGSFESYLQDEKIIAWFAQNPTIPAGGKFFPIPIGLANRDWAHGNINHFAALKAHCNKEHLLGINFRTFTFPSERNLVFELFYQQPFCMNLLSDNHEQYLANMCKTKCILSPRGNGLDCHRHWEALLCGAIPIVKTSFLNDLFQDLPVIIVDDWCIITKEFLLKEYENIKQSWHVYNFEKIYFDYWHKLITEVRQRGLLE